MKKITSIFAGLMLSAFFLQAQLNVGTGLYEFADETDIFKNTAVGSSTGTVICEGVFKFDPDATDPNLDDMASEELVDYSIINGISNRAITLKAHNWFKIWHGIPANGGGSYVNEFTVIIDVRIADTANIYSLLEVNPTPKSSGFTSEMEIAGGRVGTVEAPASGENAFGFSDNILEPNKWYRITYVAKLGEYIKVFVDGELWHSMEGNFTDALPAPYGADTYPTKAAFKVCGNNETAPDNNPPRDGDKDVDMIAVFGSTLSDAEITALGSAGDGTVGIQQMIAKYNAVNIFPNPASSILNIEVRNYSQIEIINAIGQVVDNYNINKHLSVNISNLNKGIYFVRISDNKGSIISKKLMVK